MIKASPNKQMDFYFIQLSKFTRSFFQRFLNIFLNDCYCFYDDGEGGEDEARGLDGALTMEVEIGEGGRATL